MAEDFFTNNFVSPEARQELELLVFSAMKTALEVHSHGVAPQTDRVLQICREAIPELFNDDSILRKSAEPTIVQKYRQKAHLMGISPLDLLERDIKENEDLLKNRAPEDDVDRVRKEKNQLLKCKAWLADVVESENQILNHDSRAIRSIEGKTVTPKQRGRSSIYRTKSKILVLEMLHPDKPEHTLGADLIYENYHPTEQKLRFVHVQYKLWDKDDRIYHTRGNLGKQLTRLEENICTGGYCEKDTQGASFRMPYCAAFVRLTERLQSLTSTPVSKGNFIPVCTCQSLMASHLKVDKENIKGQSLDHQTFESLFNEDMLGSRWLTFDEVRTLYNDHGIATPDDRLILFAKEVGRT